MAVTRALGQIESIHALGEKYPEQVALATTADEVRAIVGSGRVAALIGVEGGYMIEDDLRVLRMFHTLGVRYMSLTHGFNTHWADSSGTGRPVPVRHEGLSPFGVKDHARNMSDAMLRALAQNGGVIQINAVIRYIDPVERDTTPLSVFIDHIAHAIEVAGPDHVGLGLDYGYDAPAPEGLEDISTLGNVTYELLKRGYDDATVRKVLGENTLRVMQAVEEVAARLRDQEKL